MCVGDCHALFRLVKSPHGSVLSAMPPIFCFLAHVPSAAHLLSPANERNSVQTRGLNTCTAGT